jgi:glycosyltransferase involved in cell wall biosynthesis
MKILMSAYACEPDRGSEPEVGLRAMIAAAAKHDVWLLTRANNLQPLHRFLERHPARSRIRLEGFDLSPRDLRLKGRGLLGLHWYYDRWQQEAAKAAERLDHQVDFDLVHHVTFASHWTRAGVSRLSKPFVWGPVGGGVDPLPALFPLLGVRGTAEDVGRFALRRVSEMRPSVRGLSLQSQMTLVQNEETRARLRKGATARVLPNATATTLESVRPAAVRDSTVVFVGRLVPWKGVMLALRAFRHVRHPGAELRIYGDGADRDRAIRSVSALSLEDRVVFVGRLPRIAVLEQLARAGVLLHPAMHDECPLSVAEALSLRTPVVALDHGGPRELVKWWPGSPAKLIRPAGPERTARRLAQAVDEFLSSRPLFVPDPHPAPPRESFAQAILAAYDAAVSRN